MVRRIEARFSSLSAIHSATPNLRKTRPFRGAVEVMVVLEVEVGWQVIRAPVEYLELLQKRELGDRFAGQPAALRGAGGAWWSWRFSCGGN